MTWSFPIGRLLGSELRVHSTFFLLLLWIAVASYMQGGMAAAIENSLFVLALFACVIAHEYGHALMARRYGIHTPDITLLPIGGMARLERMPEKPAQEVAVALAGPAVSIAIWAILSLFLGFQNTLAGLENIADPSQGFLARLAALNLFLAIFNLLPAFPMDGGRVLRALLATSTDRVTATRLAATAGQIMAFLFGFLGLMSGNVLLLLIALFIFMAAAAESSDVALHDVARRLLAREAMITQFESLSPEDSLQAAAHALIRTTQHEFPVLDAAGNLQGFLSRNAIFSAVTSEGPPPLVADVMEREVPTIPLGAPLERALDLLQHNPVAVAVTDSHGRMIGYITRENIGELIVLAGRRGRSPV